MAETQTEVFAVLTAEKAASQRELRSQLIQTKLTSSEASELDDLVQLWRANGDPAATRSSVVRAFIRSALRGAANARED